MLIREWTKADVVTVAALERICFLDAWTEEMVRSAFESPYFQGVVLEENGAVIAYACASVLFEEAEVGTVAVVPAFRGKGLGKVLMTELENRCKEKGAEVLFLEVRVSNEPAIRLYSGRGFEKIGLRKRYYEDGEDAFVMKKSL
jgi:ribosomal-protein-alanine N-acetyltransferase